MSTKEKLYSIIENMTETQMNALLIVLSENFGVTQKKEEDKQISKVMGILREYANPELVPFEKGAWEKAAAEKHLKLMEEMNDEV